MPGLRHFLLSVCILGCILGNSGAWQVTMPRNIKGLKGSCLVIPCTFDYNQYPPVRPDHVVWYQYVSRGYPLVCDKLNPYNVINIFRGRTRKADDEEGKSCSLRIFPVDWSHHRQEIYPWVDPDNVGSSTYRFFDTTVTIDVIDRAEKPSIKFFGELNVGQSVQVECTVYHTCSTDPPTLSLNIQLRSPSTTQSPRSDGTSKTSLTGMFFIRREHQTVQCSAQHYGGPTTSASITLDAQCSFAPLTIKPTSDEFLEGQVGKVTCIAKYTCSQHLPTFIWSDKNKPVSSEPTQVSNAEWMTVSTLTFTVSASDHDRLLTCKVFFSQGKKQEVSVTLRVKRNMHFRDWSFTTPSTITGMRGSCIIIPCRFTYKNSQPADLRVMWYLYQGSSYSLVYGQSQTVDIKYTGLTSFIGSVPEGNCTLKIERLDITHNKDRFFPWLDKTSITTYHNPSQTFHDKNTQLIVSDRAEEPQLSINGDPRVGEESKVSCTVHHTCPSAPPTLTMNGIQGADVTRGSMVSDGVWERTVERTWIVKEEDQSVKCTVSYQGGQKAMSELRLNVECSYDRITMVEPPGETTEGVAKSVICYVTYKCKKNTPTIVWNYKDVQSSLQTKELSRDTFKAIANLTFIGSLSDNGKTLTCTAQFSHGETSDSAILRIKKYDRPFEETRENSEGRILAADVPFKFSALTHSCVVIPCSFQQQDVHLTRGIWSKIDGGVVYHNGQSHILDHFKDRTKILGDLHEGECSLEIDNVKPFDNGPFCFYAEKDNEKYRFNNSCAFLVMKASPEKPVMTPVPEEVNAGSTISVSCSVNHTCPSYPPVFSWSVTNLTSEVTDTMTTRGVWRRTSTITFMVSGGDGVKSLTCTANFLRDKQQASTVKINVKGSQSYQLRSSLPITILVLIILLVIILAAVLIYRRRRNTDTSLQPPPRPEKRRSLWGRLSRRYNEDRARPPRPEKRRSIWSRISSRAEDGRVGWKKGREPRHPDNSANLSVGYLNNTTTVNYEAQISKPHFPSPKDNRRTPHYVRPEDYEMYGNA